MTEWITTKEAAELRHVELITIQQWIRRGKLKNLQKFGRDWMIDKDELMQVEPISTSRGGRPRKKKTTANQD